MGRVAFWGAVFILFWILFYKGLEMIDYGVVNLEIPTLNFNQPIFYRDYQPTVHGVIVSTYSLGIGDTTVGFKSEYFNASKRRKE